MTPNRILEDVFGFTRFREGQQQVIDALVDGRSSLAVFPTGAGKSLCYQLPALMLDGMTLVVSPLIALMKDQIDFLVSKDVRAARLDSSLSTDETRTVWDDLWNGRLKLLYVAPERFASERFVQRLKRSAISLMVVDEAHCISEWGHNFRPDYLKLAALSRDLRVERVLALTATATPSVAEDICGAFTIHSDDYVNTGFHRPNLFMRAAPCSADDRDTRLLRCLQERSPGATIVYVTRQRTAEDVATFLASEGIGAKAYHAGLESEERHAVQDWFMGSDRAVVVATIAFGMGIDKPDIRYVYHYNMPKSLENYMQETGRAGRDGLDAVCDLMVCPDDVAALENFTYGDTPTRQAVDGVVNHILAQPDAFDLSVYGLSVTYDMRKLVISTLLTYLELAGILHSTGPLYNHYKFQPHRPSSEMLSGLDTDRRHFLEAIFRRAKKGRTWFSLDIAAIAAAINEPRQRIVGALNSLEERGDLTLRVAGLRHGYRFLDRPDGPDDLASTIHARFLESEQRDIGRIAHVVELAALPTCTVTEVLSYFGEPLQGTCGHCDRCRGETIPAMPPPAAGEPSDAMLELVATLVEERHEALTSARQLARFLCGLRSPAASRAGLTRDRRFAAMSHIRFSTVMELTLAHGALP